MTLVVRIIGCQHVHISGRIQWLGPIIPISRFVFEVLRVTEHGKLARNLGIGNAIESPGQAVRRLSPEVFDKLLPADPVCFEPHPIQLAN